MKAVAAIGAIVAASVLVACGASDWSNPCDAQGAKYDTAKCAEKAGSTSGASAATLQTGGSPSGEGTSTTDAQANSVGPKWQFDDTSRDYLDAKAFAPTGYHLPSMSEVLKAADAGELTTAFNTTHPSAFVWTSTPVEGKSDYFYSVLFGAGVTTDEASAKYLRKCLFLKD